MNAANYNKKSLLLMAALLLFALFPTIATAAPSFWDPSPDDVSISLILAKIFGGAIPNGIPLNIPSKMDPFGTVFAFFNGAIFTVGTLFVAYTLIAGTMQTAHDGEMLGKQWSSMWIPIRTALGVGLVVPLGSGYCVAQLLVMWITVQGVGLADKLWDSFVDNGLSDMSMLLSMPSPKMIDMAVNVLQIQICRTELANIADDPERNKAVQIAKAGTGGVDFQFENNYVDSAFLSRAEKRYQQVGYGYTTSASSTGSNTGQDFTTLDSTQVYCGYSQRLISDKSFNPANVTAGQVAGAVGAGAAGATAGIIVGAKAGAVGGAALGTVVPGVGNVALGAAGAISGAATGAVVGGLSAGLYAFWQLGIDEKKIDETLKKAHDEALAQLFVDLSPVAVSILENKSADPARFDQSIDLYQQRVNEKLKETISQEDILGDKMREDMKRYGWLTAGSWFVKIANTMNLLNQKANNTATVLFNTSKIETDTSGIQQNIKPALDRVGNYLQTTSKARYMSFGDKLLGGAPKDVQSMKDSTGASIAKEIVTAFGDLDIGNLKNDVRHPLFTMQELGVSILQWMSAGLVALIGVSALTSVAVGMTLAFLLFIGFSAAVVLAIYTPFMPFILFLGAAFGWMILVFEAMIAAPIWAVMHLTPGGNDVMGSAKQGYTLLLNLLLRPALLVMGFLAAIIIIYPFGLLLNALFFSSFISTQSNMAESSGFYHFFIFLAGTVIYAGIVLKFLHKAFDLIHVVPDQVLRWIGANDGGVMSKSAAEFQSGGQMAVAAFASQTQQNLQQSGSAATNLANLSANKAQTGKQNELNAMQEKLASDNRLESSAQGMSKARQSAASGASAFNASESGNSPTAVSTQAASFNENLKAFEEASLVEQHAQSTLSNPKATQEEKTQAKQQQQEAKELKSGALSNMRNNFDNMSNSMQSLSGKNPEEAQKLQQTLTGFANSTQHIKDDSGQPAFKAPPSQPASNPAGGGNNPPGGGGGSGGGDTPPDDGNATPTPTQGRTPPRTDGSGA